MAVINLVGERRDALPSDVGSFGAPGSQILDLVEHLPDPPVDIKLSIVGSLDSARGCLAQIAVLVSDGIPTMPQVLQSLLRSALLGAGRVVFILGPADAETREANARVVLSQEAKSLMRAYEAFEKFKHSGALIPPDHVLRAQRERSREIESWGSPIGEEKTLLRMTDVVIKTLASRGYPPETLPIMAEQINWIFHVYSGVSHGFGWPRLVPGSQSMPGHFLSELFLVASVAHIAVEVVSDRLKAGAA